MSRLLLPVDGSCVLYLPFWEGAGTFTEDISRYKNHGTITGASWTDGSLGKALLFDGLAGKGVSVASSASINVDNVFTLSAWIYVHVLPVNGDNSTIFHGLPWNSKFMSVHGVVGGATIGFYTWDTTGVAQIATVAYGNIVANVWTHVAVTFDSSVSVARLYQDGNYLGQATGTAGLLNTPSGMEIGRWIYDGFYWMDGIIDEVRVFNRVLSPAEIFEEYYRGVRGNY